MNIQFEKTSGVAAELTITFDKADYQERVEKALKNYRKKAAMPGFRPGQVPMSLMKKRFGGEITAEEVQKLLSEKLYGYLRENKVDMLGDPLASEKQQPIDFEAEQLTFIFDIALAPQFDAKLTDADKIPYYTIKVDSYQEGDMIKGHLAELDADGNVKEGGVQKEDAVILPGYFKNADEKKKFDGVQVNTVITWNPAVAYENSAIELSSLLGITKEEAEGIQGNFSYQITEITRYVAAEPSQELYDQIFGEGKVKSEEEFRAAIKAQIEEQFAFNAQVRFMTDVREYLEGRIGQLEWPEELLKRIMRANNPDKDEKYVEDNFAGSIKELEWHLIKEQLVEALEIKVNDEDVKQIAKEAARAQFAQYGMSNIPEEYLDNYAQEMLKKRENADGLVDRAVDVKLTAALKGVVKLNEKDITLEDFQKMVAGK